MKIKLQYQELKNKPEYKVHKSYQGETRTPPVVQAANKPRDMYPLENYYVPYHKEPTPPHLLVHSFSGPVLNRFEGVFSSMPTFFNALTVQKFTLVRKFNNE